MLSIVLARYCLHAVLCILSWIFRYYKALTVMETRFPISKDKAHVMISFTWYDAFRASKRTEQYSIHFEKAAIMFNLGAVLTQQALACDRTQDQGMKDAAKKFQVADSGT